MTFRYERAVKYTQRIHRYTLHMQLSVLEGVRNMMMTYATNKAEVLESILDEMVAAGIQHHIVQRLHGEL